MDKPEKKTEHTLDRGCSYDTKYEDIYFEGYNQCWDDREAWLPSYDEILSILKNVVYLGEEFVSLKSLKLLAKAIDKRLRGKK